MKIQKKLIGARIRQTLVDKGIRPTDLAERAGVSRAAVSCWLKGEKLSINHLGSIATHLDVSLNWLLLGIGSSNIAADATLTQAEEGLVQLLRYFGEDIVQHAVGMLNGLVRDDREPLKQFKAFDLVSLTKMPIVVLDAKGCLVYSNAYHDQLFGLDDAPARNLQGKHFTDWVPKIFHRKYLSILEDTLRRGYSPRTSMHLTCPTTQQEKKLIIHSRAVSTANGSAAQLLIRVI